MNPRIDNGESFLNVFSQYYENKKNIKNESEFVSELNQLLNNNLISIKDCLNNSSQREQLTNLSQKIRQEMTSKEAQEIASTIDGIISANALTPDVVGEILHHAMLPLDRPSSHYDKMMKPRQRSGLEEAALVSKTWQKKAEENKLHWAGGDKFISFKNLGCPTIDQAIDFIARNEMKDVDLREFKDFNDGHLKELYEKYPEIRSLTINGPIDKWPEMKHLHSITISKIDDASCDNLAAQCPPLQKFYFDSTTVTSKAIANLAKNCPDISTLHFQNTYRLDDSVFEELVKFSNLKDFELSINTKISDEGLKKLGACKKLEMLNVMWTQMGDNGIEALASCPLQELNLRGTKVGDRGIRTLITNCSDIQVLSLAQLDISKEVVGGLAKFSKLKELDLSSISSVSDKEIETIAENNPGLQVLNLRRTMVGDHGAKAIADHCRGLRHLDLSESEIADEGITRIVENCQDLHTLNIGDSNVLNEGVKAISKNALNLLELNLGGLRILNPEVIAGLTNCPKLSKIYLHPGKGDLLQERNPKISIQETH